jgi:hypothetical protein
MSKWLTFLEAHRLCTHWPPISGDHVIANENTSNRSVILIIWRVADAVWLKMDRLALIVLNDGMTDSSGLPFFFSFKMLMTLGLSLISRRHTGCGIWTDQGRSRSWHQSGHLAVNLSFYPRTILVSSKISAVKDTFLMISHSQKFFFRRGRWSLITHLFVHWLSLVNWFHSFNSFFLIKNFE